METDYEKGPGAEVNKKCRDVSKNAWQRSQQGAPKVKHIWRNIGRFSFGQEEFKVEIQTWSMGGKWLWRYRIQAPLHWRENKAAEFCKVSETGRDGPVLCGERVRGSMGVSLCSRVRPT